MREYNVKIAGLPHTVQLSDDEAERRGLLTEKPSAKNEPAKTNKAAVPKANKTVTKKAQAGDDTDPAA